MKAVMHRYPEDGSEQYVDIRIDPWDSWNVDTTLSRIIAPLLRQLSETTHGYPQEFALPDSEDPDGSIAMNNWKATIQKMIWSFEELQRDWEDDYCTGEVDWEYVVSKTSEFVQVVEGPNNTFTIDSEGIENHYKKIQEGIDLFAKYYMNLWD